jgi:hypothetical protein
MCYRGETPSAPSVTTGSCLEYTFSGGYAKNPYYGSGALWSGRLAAMLFSLFATLTMARINGRKWLTWFLESCAQAGGQAPGDITAFLPWNMSQEKRREMTLDPKDDS